MTIGPALPPGFVRSEAGEDRTAGANRADSADNGEEIGGENEEEEIRAEPVSTRRRSLGRSIGPSLPPSLARNETQRGAERPVTQKCMEGKGGDTPAEFRLVNVPTGMQKGQGSSQSLGAAARPPTISCTDPADGTISVAGKVGVGDKDTQSIAENLPGTVEGRKGCIERESWMLAPPAPDPRDRTLVSRGFSSKKVSSSAGDDCQSYGTERGTIRAGRKNGIPVRPGDSRLEEKAEKPEHDADDDGGSDDSDSHLVSPCKRARVDDGPSLLDRHRAKTVNQSRAGPFKPWDRDNEYVSNHKRRDASYYTARDGGLASRYGRGSGKGS